MRMQHDPVISWCDRQAIAVPEWLLQDQDRLQAQRYPDDATKMGLVLECARKNAEKGCGAPLAAAVFLDDGSLLSVGVDAPGMGGHEMSNALLLANTALGPRGNQRQPWDLYSLAPPCLACLGHIYSERPRRFVCAVELPDLLAALHLPDTPFPREDWADLLTAREIHVQAGIARAAGRKLLLEFRNLSSTRGIPFSPPPSPPPPPPSSPAGP